MFLPHSGALPYMTSIHRQCYQNGRPLPCRQSPRLRQLGALRHLSENLTRLHLIQSTLARVVTMQRGRISISKMLSDLHWLPFPSPLEVPFRLHGGDINIQSPWVWEPGYLYSRIGIGTSRWTLRLSADTRKLSVFHKGSRSARELFDTGTAGLEQSITGHSQRFIRTIVQVKIKNSLLQTGLQLTELDLHCAFDSASCWHCTWCLFCSINGHNNYIPSCLIMAQVTSLTGWNRRVKILC